ncbi:hypothetical protein CHS0354_004110 [Potamilus streckersoni]|uniref:Uncharacterized protein n=1 Tax=Potamilus streckersoni TaxID=2493646 RepID=A0AAE0SJY8_9BIVA|nr:hypothetical protein CHS0354_004110 [Potamilus streckersoni]
MRTKTSLDDVLKDLAETSTIHGIPRFVPGRHWTIRLLWVLAFLFSSGYMLYQLVGLFDEYFSYKVNVRSSSKFSALRFPAISFCNMNPIKLSKLGDASTSLRELIEESFTLELETYGRRKRNTVPLLSRSILPTPASLFDKPLLSMQTPLLEGSLLLLPFDSSTPDALNPGFNSILPNIGNVEPSSIATLLSVYPNDLNKDYIWKNLDQINEKDLLTSYLSKFSGYNTFVGEEFVENGAVDWQYYFYQELLAVKDQYQEKTELFRVFFRNQTL